MGQPHRNARAAGPRSVVVAAITLLLVLISMPATADVEPTALSVVAPPTITGTARVGSPLTVTLGEVAPAPDGHNVEWIRQGEVVGTGATYVPQPADAGVALRARVTWSRAGFEDHAVESAQTSAVALGTQAAFAPKVSGTFAPGRTLGVTGLPASGTKKYQWYRNGKAVSGASKSTYTVPSTALGATVAVKVTNSAAGYAPKSAQSAAVRIAKPFATAAPVIKGTAKVGRLLSVSTPAWKPTAKVTYQWLRDGNVIPGATSSRYYPVAADAGTSISVRATGKRSGYATSSRTSAKQVVALGTIEHDAPRIAGVVRQNREVAVDAGVVTPSTVQLAYEWFLDGVAIPDATSGTTTVFNSYLRKRLSVKVTYSAPGYATKTTEVSQIVLRDRPAVMARPAYYSPSGAAGAIPVQAGTYYAAQPSVYCQWSLDSNKDPDDGVISSGGGAAIVGVTIPADAAYFTSSFCGGWTPPFEASEEVPWTAPDPTVATIGSRAGLTTFKVSLSGSVDYNGLLRAKVTETLPAADYYTYTWKVGGKVSDGGPTFDISPSWQGKRVTVTATAHRAGFRSTSASATSGPVTNANADRPGISGTPVVGAKLTATHVMIGNVKYQWLRDGKPIAGATAKTRKLTSYDAGHKLSFRVTKYSRIFGTQVKTSAKTGTVLRVFTTAPAPVVSGSPSVGVSLKATTRAWTGAPTRTYQWNRNRVPIPGATASSYVVSEDDLGSALSVSVTGKRSGYVTKTVASSAIPVRVAGEIWAAPPRITGTVRAGETLTVAVSASFPSTATRALQWYRDGDPIAGATGKTFALKNRDIGTRLEVRVTYTAEGLPEQVVSSRPTSAVVPRSALTTGYGDRVHIYGYDADPKEIPPGTYSAPGGAGCEYHVAHASGGGVGHKIVVVPPGFYDFISFNCGPWRLEDGTFPDEGFTFESGVHQVGKSIPEGLYRRDDEGSLCTVYLTDSWSDPFAATTLDFGVQPSSTIAIFASDKFIVTGGCGTWTRVGDLPADG